MKIEKQLIRRLKILGFLLIFFAAATHFYRFIPTAVDELDMLEEEIVLELDNPPPLNPFFVSSVFAIVGASCLLISWKKNKTVSSSPQNTDHQ